jgi:ubiquinone/menaquinone biosynthesis C-methylase UbiE
MRKVLHVGCGRSPLPAWMTDCDETRLDIDPGVQPDVVASMLDMGDIGGFDMVYSSHSLEHVYPHEVPVALAEMFRVLKPGGVVVAIVPNLDGVKPDETPLYWSEAGPVCGLDMIYGMSRLIRDHPYMAHHSGFIPDTLTRAIESVGFQNVHAEAIEGYTLMGVGVKP